MLIAFICSLFSRHWLTWKSFKTWWRRWQSMPVATICQNNPNPVTRMHTHWLHGDTGMYMHRLQCWCVDSPLFLPQMAKRKGKFFYRLSTLFTLTVSSGRLFFSHLSPFNPIFILPPCVPDICFFLKKKQNSEENFTCHSPTTQVWIKNSWISLWCHGLSRHLNRTEPLLMLWVISVRPCSTDKSECLLRKGSLT